MWGNRIIEEFSLLLNSRTAMSDFITEQPDIIFCKTATRLNFEVTIPCLCVCVCQHELLLESAPLCAAFYITQRSFWVLFLHLMVFLSRRNPSQRHSARKHTQQGWSRIFYLIFFLLHTVTAQGKTLLIDNVSISHWGTHVWWHSDIKNTLTRCPKRLIHKEVQKCLN